ncbi:SDR family oxidoreductase [Burkholderia oklahomensis]|uniref:Short chain dehydrogenase family protein n=1 Tax=Burkholderia oklahomensis TaxID=342113 RepID=A0AAI8B9Y4_9BURK|nr:SDR family oxidoreductase [Burkholderia oklahomensis]AIO68241.1 short chain dehydrogenase family protein [Burkholderia oklahomensis]AJX32479.1 short chain dehydrogenase family protein [Burkholderia oklahomensis C6786]AOI43248.1 short-chain dehydrogenase [Burkholderia oklahomensis EO147]AOI46821.1 short-chain dehydrogenase [Burkholderia oklahomensis C6786]KUY47528.1 short-chain dehydrogenase [Burkholderia oklahomensis EO147]
MSRVVLVTGACGGIGSVLCRRFVEHGDVVLALDVGTHALDSLVRELGKEQVTPVAANLEHPIEAAIESAVELRGPVEVLVANAGAATGPTLETTDAASWQRDIQLNLTGTYHSVEAVRASMIERQRGALVLVGSVNGMTALGHPAYSAAKAGLISYTKSLAMELGRYGIRANIVCPGTVKTLAWQARVEKNPQVFEDLKKWYPLRDFATPGDIADAVWFLASPMARVITGVALPVDSGLMAGNRLMAAELTLEAL